MIQERSNNQIIGDSEEDQYIEHLRMAHIHAQKALDALYKPFGVKRGWWYRITLGRAQNALITVYVREINKIRGDIKKTFAESDEKGYI